MNSKIKNFSLFTVGALLGSLVTYQVFKKDRWNFSDFKKVFYYSISGNERYKFENEISQRNIKTLYGLIDDKQMNKDDVMRLGDSFYLGYQDGFYNHCNDLTKNND